MKAVVTIIVIVLAVVVAGFILKTQKQDAPASAPVPSGQKGALPSIPTTPPPPSTSSGQTPLTPPPTAPSQAPTPAPPKTPPPASSLPAPAPTPTPTPPPQPPTPPPAAQVPATVDVTIKNFAFLPAEVRIKAGTTVRWTHQDAAGHTVTADNGAFGSNTLSQGQTFARAFSEKGSFGYHCAPHPSMTGTVIVE